MLDMVLSHLPGCVVSWLFVDMAELHALSARVIVLDLHISQSLWSADTMANWSQ